jgi:crotonobetainyl-CoA:carnitine CoA-transferase CaiB-like acyl-CoA transferase
MHFDSKNKASEGRINRRKPVTGCRPLKGTRVVEAVDVAAPLHIRLAISMAGKIAAELGADVTALEPPGGDPIRKLPPFVQGPGRRSALFEFLNAEKSIIPARSRVESHDLLAGADAVLIDGSSGVPDNTTTVVVSTFGPHQPDLQEPASELTLMAMSGVLHLIGEQAGEPVRLAGHQPSYAAGLAAFLAMTAGLLAPTPKIADVCVLDALLWINWKILSGPVLNAKTPGKAVNEWQAVAAIDGHIALVYMDRDWPVLAELVGDVRLRENRFATRPARLENMDALMAVLRPWFAVRRKADIYREARLRNIPLGPVWTISDLLRDAQYLERDFLAHTPAGVMPRLPVMWNGKRPQSAKSAAQPAERSAVDV